LLNIEINVVNRPYPGKFLADVPYAQESGLAAGGFGICHVLHCPVLERKRAGPVGPAQEYGLY
jgi:hypothetical protein